ncbi:MAG: hypothetical protein HPY58_03535 [Firmicutes bacterium]|nr:hypothetical protein [Bacillota bacterium]
MAVGALHPPDLPRSAEGSAEVRHGAGEKPEDERLKKACQELEGIFWHYLLRAMRKTIPRGGLLEKSSERAIYEDLLDEQYALLLARRGFSGIGKILYEQLRRPGGKES